MFVMQNESMGLEAIDDYSSTYELCPICEVEVRLVAKFEAQVCPSCASTILPCSICVCDSCLHCPLET